MTPVMMQSFRSELEPVLMAVNVTRMTRFNKAEMNKVFVLTGDCLYLFEGSQSQCSRRHEISNLSSIIKSSVSSEVVFKLPTTKDLRLRGLTEEQRSDL